MKCRICGCEKETRRQMHGHLMHTHYNDYKIADFVLDRLVDGAILAERPKKEKEKKAFLRPNGFRLLRRSNPAEENAINQGYDFIDDEEFLYTEQEARVEGWI